MRRESSAFLADCFKSPRYHQKLRISPTTGMVVESGRRKLTIQGSADRVTDGVAIRGSISPVVSVHETETPNHALTPAVNAIASVSRKARFHDEAFTAWAPNPPRMARSRIDSATTTGIKAGRGGLHRVVGAENDIRREDSLPSPPAALLERHPMDETRLPRK